MGADRLRCEGMLVLAACGFRLVSDDNGKGFVEFCRPGLRRGLHLIPVQFNGIPFRVSYM